MRTDYIHQANVTTELFAKQISQMKANHDTLMGELETLVEQKLQEVKRLTDYINHGKDVISPFLNDTAAYYEQIAGYSVDPTDIFAGVKVRKAMAQTDNDQRMKAVTKLMEKLDMNQDQLKQLAERIATDCLGDDNFKLEAPVSEDAPNFLKKPD